MKRLTPIIASEIATLHLREGMTQRSLAKKYELHQTEVSIICKVVAPLPAKSVNMQQATLRFERAKNEFEEAYLALRPYLVSSVG